MVNRSVILGRYEIPLHVLGIVLLSLLHLIGIVGITTEASSSFIFLTPINLLVSAIAMLSFHSTWNARSFIYFLLCYSIGLGAELIGTNTGLIFGNYSYGEVLGWQVLGTPLIIGINWLLLVYASNEVINFSCSSCHRISRAALAAGAMVSLDFVIEPVAIKLGFWTWKDGPIPISNYLAWFLIGMTLSLFHQYLLKKQRNKVAAGLFWIQLIFFILLNFLLV